MRHHTVLPKTVLSALLAAGAIAGAPSASAAVIFSDDFESGNMNNWTTTGTNPLEISTVQNVVPDGPGSSALMNTSIDRMHRNLIDDNGGSELSGPSTFTSFIYDPGNTSPATRVFSEVRGYTGTGLPNGGTVADGALAQLLAIGKYNTVTRAGEVYNANKYQARVTFPSTVGWFNLDGEGSPDRSAGWHRFDVERLDDGTTINFYVDGVLSETIEGAASSTWDTLVLGPGLGSAVGDAWIDGISITDTVVPEPSALALVAVGGLALLRRRRGA